MLINAEPFLGIISSYRLLHIAGRFGGGKTSLAYEIFRRFGDDGYRLISNNRSVWADDGRKLSLLDDGSLKAVVIIDEGGLYFESSKQVKMIASYARKMDVIYIIPSFFQPVRTACVLTAQPLFNFKAAGLPLIIYRWRVKQNAFEDKGYFGWWWPQSIFGVYSTKDPGDTASEIITTLVEKTEEFQRHFERGRSDDLSDMEEEVTEAERLQDAVAQFSDSIEDFTTVSIRSKKRRRF